MHEKELFTPVESDLIELRKAEEQFLDVVDRITNNHHYSISKKEGMEVKSRISIATRILTKEQVYSRKLEDKDINRIWNLIDRLQKDENVTVLLRQMEGGTGIEEVISKQKFLFK